LFEYEGGPRLITECYIEIPKKNGKTTLLAGIENLLLFWDGEAGAEIYNCAGDDQQANLLFRTAKFMILQNDVLKRNSEQLQTEIRFKNSFIKKLTSEAKTKHGLNAHAVIYDELHAAGNPELYETLKYAGSQRRNSIFFQITTAGSDQASICWNRHEYTRKINEGLIEDDNFWGIIYCADLDDDPYDEATWKKANPMYEHSETFRRKFKKDAKEAQNDVALENAFKRLRLNVWTGATDKWIPDEDWMKGAAKLPDLTGRTCYAGLDMASTADTTSLVLLFPEDDRYYIMPFVFVPERMIQKKEQRNEFYYEKWRKEGYLIRTPGNITDYQYIRKKLNDLSKVYDIQTIGFDPYNAYQEISKWKDEDGFKVVEYRQGIPTMGEPTKEFERIVLDNRIIHGGHPVLRWMMDNVVLRRDPNDNYMIGKGKHSTGKVDGIVATIIALGEAIEHKEKEPEIYTGNW